MSLSGTEQAEESESGFHARDYTLSVYTRDILREEEKLDCGGAPVSGWWACATRDMQARAVGPVNPGLTGVDLPFRLGMPL